MHAQHMPSTFPLSLLSKCTQLRITHQVTIKSFPHTKMKFEISCYVVPTLVNKLFRTILIFSNNFFKMHYKSDAFNCSSNSIIGQIIIYCVHNQFCIHYRNFVYHMVAIKIFHHLCGQMGSH